MSTNSKIEWTDHTFNPWEGCQKVGPGCDHCYAEARNARFGGGVAVNWGPGAERRRTSPANWHKPLAWNEAHAEFFAQQGRRQRVFCASLADVFDNAVDPQWRSDLFDLIGRTPNLDWLLLTKRIGNTAKMLDDYFPGGWASWVDRYPNVWLGATIVNQEEADRDIPKLLAVPTARRFLSMEPLLGPVDLSMYLNPVWCEDCDWNGTDCAGPEDGDSECPKCGSSPVFFRTGEKLDWVIAGGESGLGARPMHPDWARSLRDQCEAAGVPFLFKQWGEWNPGNVYAAIYAKKCVRIDKSGAVHPYPPGFYVKSGDWCMYKLGKKAAGRQLDGNTHDGFPA